MNIIVSQQNKKITVEFHYGKNVEKFVIAKADELLVVIDKLIKKSKINLITFKNAQLEFHNVGLLTERVIRVIMSGLSF